MAAYQTMERWSVESQVLGTAVAWKQNMEEMKETQRIDGPNATDRAYHQRQLVGISGGAGEGRQTRSDLVVTVTASHRQNSDVPELLRLRRPLLPDRHVELCGRGTRGYRGD